MDLKYIGHSAFEFALKEKSIELEQSRIEKLTNNPFKDLTIEQLMELARIDDEK